MRYGDNRYNVYLKKAIPSLAGPGRKLTRCGTASRLKACKAQKAQSSVWQAELRALAAQRESFWLRFVLLY
jgi:hypothetical protein